MRRKVGNEQKDRETDELEELVAWKLKVVAATSYPSFADFAP